MSSTFNIPFISLFTNSGTIEDDKIFFINARPIFHFRKLASRSWEEEEF